METKTGLKLKSLRSDNRGEYDSAEFKSFCAQQGVKQVRTVPNRPQQNGVADSCTAFPPHRGSTRPRHGTPRPRDQRK